MLIAVDIKEAVVHAFEVYNYVDLHYDKRYFFVILQHYELLFIIPNTLRCR